MSPLVGLGIGADIADSVVNTVGNLVTGFGYNKKWLQRKIWEREDTAVQRRAADLEAAGLSKTLAAGSAAQAGPIVQSGSPGSSLGEAFSKIQQRRLVREQESQTRAQAWLMRAQGEQAHANTAAAIAAAQKTQAEMEEILYRNKKTQAETEEILYRTNWWRDRDLPPGGTGGRITQEAVGLHALIMEYGRKGADAVSQMSADLAAKVSAALGWTKEQLKIATPEQREKRLKERQANVQALIDSGIYFPSP